MAMTASRLATPSLGFGFGPSPFPPPLPGAPGFGPTGPSFKDRLADLGFGAATDIIRGFTGGGGGGGTAGQTASDLARRALELAVPGGATGSCPGMFSVRGPDGRCINIGSALPGGDPFITQQVNGQGGVAVNGRFGTGNVPIAVSSTKLRCAPGQVLGKDDICYDNLPKKDRKWNPGTPPLFTGGERAAVAIAARVAGKMKTQQKRLQKLGLLPKPKSGGSRKPDHPPPPQVVVVDTD